MKTMILAAAAAALSLGLGSAYANDGGYGGTTQFTSIPGVVAHATVPSPASAVAQNGQVNVYATQSSGGTWLFQPAVNGGGNS
jgi:beta-glucosidase-like glycosyl hydrolase